MYIKTMHWQGSVVPISDSTANSILNLPSETGYPSWVGSVTGSTWEGSGDCETAAALIMLCLFNMTSMDTTGKNAGAVGHAFAEEQIFWICAVHGAFPTTMNRLENESVIAKPRQIISMEASEAVNHLRQSYQTLLPCHVFLLNRKNVVLQSLH